jgi:ubiquinone/menaquinone biosynthesis C-methylase UbiE
MNCDPIARAYRYLEYASFGSALQRRRCHFLPQLSGARKVLMLGEGDGRFLAEFVRQIPQAEVDYADRSAKMLELARWRAASSRVRFHHRNLLADALPGGKYDTIITHFFLDCLSDDDVTFVVQRTALAARSGAIWVVSEFREPDFGWQRLRAKLWVAGLYAAFRVVTRLSTRKLPDHASALRNAGFRLEQEALASAGLLTSQLWVRS